jgi:hypothetical protein
LVEVPSEPEINVQGNSVSIVKGDTSPALADHTDFGATSISTPLVRTYTIQNTGTAVLTITSIVSSNAKFVVSGVPTTVAAGSSATFNVTYTPTVLATDDATITINNDDTDEAVYDFAITGKAINATPSGVRGNMLNLDGSGYVSFTNNPLSASTNFTIETWVRVDNLSDWRRIVDFGDAQGDNMFLTSSYGGSGGRPRFVINVNNTGERILDSSIPILSNTWTHIAVTLSGTTAIMYINGINVGQNNSFDINPASLGATTNNWLGKSQYPDPLFQGSLDELKIWNVARTQDQIRENMHLTLAGSESGLVAYYQFNETSGVAIDAVAGNNGTLNGGASRITSNVAVAKGTSHSRTVSVGMNAFTNANLAINFTTAPADEFVAYQLDGNPFNGVNALNQGTNTSSCYWVVRQFGVGALAYDGMNFTVPSSNIISAADVTTPSNLKLHKRPDNSTAAFPASFASATSANNTTKVIEFTGFTSQSSFSQFEIASGSSPLPITLLSFEGRRQDKDKVNLTWKTATESNNKGFEIETGQDANNFTKIAFVDGAGSSNRVRTYGIDINNSDDAYYRLKQIDFDGTFAYSNIVFVKGNEGTIKIYPNPSSENISIELGDWKSSDISSFEIQGLQGKTLSKGNLKASKTTLNINHLPKGMYLLQVLENGKKTTQKIVIQ